jgi:diguanylate cyclase (GGDEF)-like protein
MPIAEFYRLDPLTGSHNFLSFVEALDHLSNQEERKPFSVLYLDMNHLEMLNNTKGHAYGDSALRWLEIVLREESNSETYRIGGDDFAVILTSGTRSGYEELLHRVFIRLNKEGEPMGIPSPVARIALIHYDKADKVSLYDVIFHLWETMLDVKANRDRAIHSYFARDLFNSDGMSKENTWGSYSVSPDTLRWIANHAISRIILMGRMLDDAQRTSYLDSISGLPNMRAALLKIDKAVTDASASNQPFSILLIDGDNIRRYNSISYIAGDEMIENMGKALSEKLRPGDFIARWRTGDEFIVILPNTSGERARLVGERFCSAIRDASKTWKFSTSISIGIATYPQHGDNANVLVDMAEKANKQAKDAGKDRVLLAE